MIIDFVPTSEQPDEGIILVANSKVHQTPSKDICVREVKVLRQEIWVKKPLKHLNTTSLVWLVEEADQFVWLHNLIFIWK